MKRIKIKPRLVDHALFQPIRPLPPHVIVKKLMPPVQETPSNLSVMFNVIGLFILAIGGLYLYQRYADREVTEDARRHTIIGFNQYVTDNLGKDERGSDTLK